MLLSIAMSTASSSLDPHADLEEAMHEYGVRLNPFDGLPFADAIVAAVAHPEFGTLVVEDLCRKVIERGACIDAKAAFDVHAIQAAGLRLWRL
jgi:UDP-N-acetyl-D-galactosamine dehydrogenase